ncbi:MAG TPA: universal stress protein [Ktedonobacteraceae bacterium]|nr:universal stress protein [Ktedonobacteraceae bacterium]
MFQRILLPLDGSARAERAVPIAARLAHATGGSIILVRVVNKSSKFLPSLESPPTLAHHVLISDIAKAEQYLVDIAASPDFEGIAVETEVRFGPVVPTLLAVADNRRADLIVLCSHGYSGMIRRIMGSVAEQLTRHTWIPVLVLRENGPLPGERYQTAERPFRALVPLDGSQQVEAVLEPTASLLALLASRGERVLHMVRVVEPVRASIKPGGMLTETKKAIEYLSTLANDLRTGSVAPAAAQDEIDVTWSIAVDTYVVETLTQPAEEEVGSQGPEVFGDCDLIALAASARDGVQHWALGNITERLLLDTRFPLLIVPVPGQNRSWNDEREERLETETNLFPLSHSHV